MGVDWFQDVILIKGMLRGYDQSMLLESRPCLGASSPFVQSSLNNSPKEVLD